jgi:hypothetical protein
MFAYMDILIPSSFAAFTLLAHVRTLQRAQFGHEPSVRPLNEVMTISGTQGFEHFFERKHCLTTAPGFHRLVTAYRLEGT